MAEQEPNAEDHEAQAKRLLNEQRIQDAIELILRVHGNAIRGFLLGLLRDEFSAGEAYSQFCEALWVSLENFEGKCSIRTWSYAVARYQASNWLRKAQSRNRRETPSEQAMDIFDTANRTRTGTPPYLRTTIKDELSAIRAELTPSDQALLTLRVDRAMSWEEIAIVFFDDVLSEEPSLLKKRSALLRKRFERLTLKLRKIAQERGLLDV